MNERQSSGLIRSSVLFDSESMLAPSGVIHTTEPTNRRASLLIWLPSYCRRFAEPRADRLSVLAWSAMFEAHMGASVLMTDGLIQ